MSSFAKTKCPRCGAVIQHHLGGYGWLAHGETTRCYCGFEYRNEENCIENIPDRDDDESIPSSRTQNELQNRLAKFSTEELEREMKRRKG